MDYGGGAPCWVSLSFGQAFPGLDGEELPGRDAKNFEYAEILCKVSEQTVEQDCF